MRKVWHAFKIVGGILLAVGTALLFAFGYRNRHLGLGDAKINLGDAQDGQRAATGSACRVADAVDASKAGLERVAESLDAGTRGIDDAQSIAGRDEKLIGEAEDILARYK